jgi:RimJ/RimL family protein N-acetyltransferase
MSRTVCFIGEVDGGAQHLTDPVLTPRLRLTPIGPADVTDLLVLYSDPIVAWWTGPWNRASVTAWTGDMVTRWKIDGVGKWLARSRADASLVGRGGFSRFDLNGERVLELGWVVRDDHTGRGYATEIGRAALDWAETHEPRTPIVAFTEVHNEASQAVMRHLGMRPTRVIHRQGRIDGHLGLHPHAPFAVYRIV